jgi:hypothetical protein
VELHRTGQRHDGLHHQRHAQIVLDIGWNERNTPYDFWYPDASFCPKVRNGEGWSSASRRRRPTT